MNATTTSPTAGPPIDHGPEHYDRFEAAVAAAASASAGSAWFTTDTDPEVLWDTYLASLPADRRQHYNCHACRSFLRRYGGLVTVDADGRVVPVFWTGFLTGVPDFFQAAAAALHRVVASFASVTGVFLSKEATLGRPRDEDAKTGTTWTHLHATNPAPFRAPVLSAGQRAAELTEDRRLLAEALAAYPPELVAQAARVLRSEALTRSEKGEGVVDWLAACHADLADKKGKARNNRLWALAAAAPTGYCHVKSSGVVGTLLDDLRDGLEFDAVKRRWAEKLHPLQYQRPQAAPSAGSIDRAEKVFAQLDAASALNRRYARLDEVQRFFWKPTPARAASPAGGTFGHLRKPAASAPGVEIPEQLVTWVKFRDTVLPAALSVEVYVPSSSASFYALTAAADPESRPILQWDGLEGKPRNPYAWYFYQAERASTSWNLLSGWHQVTAVFPPPPHWQDPAKFGHQDEQAFFAIAGCREVTPGVLGLFPECLKSEYREVRSVVEAHAGSARIPVDPAADANGLGFSKGSGRGAGHRFRVRDGLGTALYRMDRWD